MKPTESALVSIIAINYNTLQVTCELLESLSRLSYRNFEAIVVDNASKEDPSAYLQANYPWATVVRSEENLGFAGGNNLGMQHAKGDYFLFLNNDTEVEGDLLEQLMAPFEQYADTGAVSPKIKFFHHPDTIQYAGFHPINPYTGRTGAVGSREKDQGQFSGLYETFGAHGAAMMVSRTVVEKVGQMPEMYFLYYEEWDWSASIRRAGHKIYCQSEATVLHKESMSTGKESTLKAYYHIRNRILYMKRNSEWWQFLLFLCFTFGFSVPKAVVGYIKNQQYAHLRAFMKGLAWNFTAQPNKL